MWNVFISHASEDKAVARPLAAELTRRGYRVWFDESGLTVGDSLNRSINEGLAKSRYGIVILSPSFFAKEWPRRELDGLSAKEMDGQKVILPVWHSLGKEEIARYSPVLADRLATNTIKGIPAVADDLARVLEGEREMEPKQVFLMHVGHPGNIDLEYTVKRRRRIGEVTDQLSRDAPERDYFESDLSLHRAFPDGRFNCWGVPNRAEPSFSLTGIGDLVLFAPVTGAHGGICQIGIVKAKCPLRCFEASRILWPNTPDQRLYPWLFFFDAEIGFRSWRDFAEDLGYDPNWNPHGWYRRVKPSHLTEKGGPAGYLKLLRENCGFRPLSPSE